MGVKFYLDKKFLCSYLVRNRMMLTATMYSPLRARPLPNREMRCKRYHTRNSAAAKYNLERKVPKILYSLYDVSSVGQGTTYWALVRGRFTFRPSRWSLSVR